MAETPMNAPSMAFVAPSGVQIVSPDSQINSPVAATTGAVVQQGQQMLSGSDKNTPPGPPIFKWNKYDLCWNAYWGTGGYYDGTVLKKLRIELDDDYLIRRSLTFYRNFFKQIIDATYKPVFSAGYTRVTKVNEVIDKEGKLAPLWNGFMENVDNRHRTLGQFTKRVVKNARILGVCYVVVDNFPEIPKDMLVADALKNRKFPYVYIRLPQQVEEKMVVLDDFCKIQEIVFKEAPEKVINPDTKAEEMEPRWRRWTTEYSVMLRKDKDGNFIEIIKSKREHGLDEVPVIPVMSSEAEDDTVLPHPSFYDLCRCNWAIFNWDSYEAQTIVATMYPTLVLPRPSGTEVSNLQSMGRQQALLAPPSENGSTPAEPKYLDYPTTCFQAVNDYIQTLIDDLFRQAGQLGVSAKATAGAKGQSGVSKSYDFYAQSFVLKESSKMAVNCETEIARIFKLYVIGEKFDYESNYEEDFEPEEDPEADVKLYGDYIALNPGPKGKALAMKQMTHSIFDDAEEDDVSEVIEEIDEQLKTDLKDKQDVTEETPEEKAAREAAEAAALADAERLRQETLGKPPASQNPATPPNKKAVKKGTPRRGFSIKKKGGAA